MSDVKHLVNVITKIAQIASIANLAYEAYKKALKINQRKRLRPLNVTREERTFFQTCIRQLQEKDEHFYKVTRMDVENFELLLSLLNERLQRYSNRKPIDPETRLAVTLMYLAHGCKMQVLAWAFKLGFSTIRKIIFETCDAIWEELHAVCVSPPNSHQLKTISDNFYYKTGVPNCLGAIDGKHIHITRPYNSGSSDYSNKKTFGIVLLAACDSNYVFTYVDIGAPGSPDDGGVFARSDFGSRLLNGSLEIPSDANLPSTSTIFPHYFVVDNVFPHKTNLMRPYPGHNLSEDKDKFNTMLSKARGHIENCFGILANRWRVLHKKIHACPQNANKIVLATIVLHNFLMQHHDKNYFTPDLVDHAENGQNIQGRWRNETQPLKPYQPKSANRSSSNVLELRDTLKDFFQSNIV